MLLKRYNDYPKMGIYCLFNLFNNKYYIGSSVNMSKRVYDHFYALKRNKHYNRHLQRSYNKYHYYLIAFVLEDIVEYDNLLKREQYWIDRLNASDPMFGYNLSPTVNGTRGYKFSKEQLKHLSESHKGENHPNYGKHLSEITKKRIGMGNTGKIRSKETRKKLRDAKLGKPNSEESKIKVSKAIKDMQLSDEQIHQIAMAKAKQVYQFDLNMNLLNTFESGAEAARQLDFKRSCICRACRGERDTYQGYIWKFADDYNSVNKLLN